MEDNTELESFRRQWREEVARRARQENNGPVVSQSPVPLLPEEERFPPTRHAASKRIEDEEREEEFDNDSKGDDDDKKETLEQDRNGKAIRQMERLTLGPAEPDVDGDGFGQLLPREPSSALEHFERAVQKEAEGSLGDSLSHYRKAYRLDSTVDKKYRNKHFAHSWKPLLPQASDSAAKPALDSQGQEEEGVRVPLSTPELIEGFAREAIPPAEPLIENTPPPPCPIARIPSEVLVDILGHVAVMDPALFCRLSLVCKRFAYHFAHEQHIWKRLCQGAEFGFAAMHYSFACDVLGNPIYTLAGSRYTPFPRDAGRLQIPRPFGSWSQVFQSFPRIRFTGIYISTVNYTRAGAASAYQSISWNSPIHIVTYFRYLRFYPDGSVISLLTTTEPTEIVPYISWENMVSARALTASPQWPHQHHHKSRHSRLPDDPRHPDQRHVSDSSQAVGPSAATDPVPAVALSTLKHALRGRWHLCEPVVGNPGSSDATAPASGLKHQPSGPNQALGSGPLDPRDVIIETEGVGPKYVYTLHLSLRSAGSSSTSKPGSWPANPAKNTKLGWKGFWSYNKLTDDWAEFGLRNDRAFVFRRVRGWGLPG